MRFRALSISLVAFVGLAPPVAAGASQLLRLNGIGPLKLQQARSSAVATHWLAHRSTGCPLGGPPLPIVYRVDGASAPAGLNGAAEFDNGRLVNLAFEGNVHTAIGVRPGTTRQEMVRRYRAAGYVASARYADTIAGTFITVRRHKGGRQILGGFATGGIVRQLGVPGVRVCE